MSSELEQRLEAMLAEAPEPEPGAGEEALHRALRSLHAAAPVHRGVRTVALAFAAAVVLLAVAAGSLAAAGAIHVSFGTKKKPRLAVPAELTLPKGKNGTAAIVDGKLSVVTNGGFRLQGFPASAEALSPHSLYVAAGIGSSIVAMKPNGHQVWSHSAGGCVVAIAWAPDAIRIAYIAQSGHRFALHVIWGTGTHDKVVDRSVRPVRPSWRADNLALAYVGAGGKALVYDIEHSKHIVSGPEAPVTSVAFAPTGKTLLVATPRAALLDGRSVASGEIEAIGWLHGHPAAALSNGVRSSFVRTFGGADRPLEDFHVPGRVLGITGGLVVTRAEGRILAGWRTKTVNTLLTVRRAASVDDVAIG